MTTRFSRGYSPIVITAALSVAALVAVAGTQLGKALIQPAPTVAIDRESPPREHIAIEDADKNGIPDWQDTFARAGFDATASSSALSATSSDPLSGIGHALANSLISGYLSLTKHDAYTPERGERLAETIANNFRAPATFTPHTNDELLLDETASEKRAITYRADMRVALEPLISDEEYELTLYAAYVETEDSMWLERLTESAERYRTAETRLLEVSVPRDAAMQHLRIVNALGEYAETLDRMVHFARDPLASMALLTTYNERERDLDLAFDALVKYYARTINDN